MASLENIENKLNKVQKEFDENNLAMEMLKEMKHSAKRWFIVSIILLIMLFATNIAWIIYEIQFETVETSTMELLQEDVTYSNQSGVIN